MAARMIHTSRLPMAAVFACLALAAIASLAACRPAPSTTESESVSTTPSAEPTVRVTIPLKIDNDPAWPRTFHALAYHPTVTDTLPAPTIGVRYWLSDMLGIEAALGLNITSEDLTGTVESSAFGFALHGGVPLALASSGHFVFEIVPLLNFGIASGSVETTGGAAMSTDVSGLLIEVGARAGAEIHFGFIDLPSLSLQGSVGLIVRHENRSITPPGGAFDGGNAPNYPDIEDRLQVFTTVLRYHWTENLTLEGMYAFEKLSLSDFRVDGLDPFMAESNVNGGGVVSTSLDVFLGNRLGDYKAHIFALSAIYRF